MSGINKLEDLLIQYGLVSQMQRSAVSAPSNIAEGFGRRSRNEFRQFLSIAIGSLAELKTQILIAQRVGYIKESDLLVSEIEKLGKQISSFLQKVR